MKRWLPWITGAAVSAVLILSFVYFKDLHPLGMLSARLSAEHMEGVAIRFQDAKLIGRAGGDKTWTFQAKTIDLSKDRRFATFEGISQGALMDGDERIALISAEKVIYNVITRDLNVPDAAEIELEDGLYFKVRDVFWNAGTSELVCKRGVEATFNGNTLQGERMTANLEMKELTIHKVQGQIRIPE